MSQEGRLGGGGGEEEEGRRWGGGGEEKGCWGYSMTHVPTPLTNVSLCYNCSFVLQLLVYYCFISYPNQSTPNFFVWLTRAGAFAPCDILFQAAVGLACSVGAVFLMWSCDREDDLEAMVRGEEDRSRVYGGEEPPPDPEEEEEEKLLLDKRRASSSTSRSRDDGPLHVFRVPTPCSSTAPPRPARTTLAIARRVLTLIFVLVAASACLVSGFDAWHNHLVAFCAPVCLVLLLLRHRNIANLYKHFWRKVHHVSTEAPTCEDSSEVSCGGEKTAVDHPRAGEHAQRHARHSVRGGHLQTPPSTRHSVRGGLHNKDLPFSDILATSAPPSSEHRTSRRSSRRSGRRSSRRSSHWPFHHAGTNPPGIRATSTHNFARLVLIASWLMVIVFATFMFVMIFFGINGEDAKLDLLHHWTYNAVCIVEWALIFLLFLGSVVIPKSLVDEVSVGIVAEDC